MATTTNASTKQHAQIVAKKAHDRVHAPSTQPRHNRGTTDGLQWPQLKAPKPPRAGDPIYKIQPRTASSPKDDRVPRPLEHGNINGIGGATNKAFSPIFIAQPAPFHKNKNDPLATAVAGDHELHMHHLCKRCRLPPDEAAREAAGHGDTVADNAGRGSGGWRTAAGGYP